MTSLTTEEEILTHFSDVFADEYSSKNARYTEESEPEGTVRTSISRYGIQCERGWFPLIAYIAKEIRNKNASSYDSKDEEDTKVQIVQVKEKFGGLRIYTNSDSKNINQKIRTVEDLSKEICEYCGESDTASSRVVRGIIKTLCNECLLSKLQSETQFNRIKIESFEHECHQCENMATVQYPYPLGSKQFGGDWSVVSAIFNSESIDSSDIELERVYSDTQSQLVWGNICKECGTYIGNYYVRDDYLNSDRPDEEFNTIMEVSFDSLI